MSIFSTSSDFALAEAMMSFFLRTGKDEEEIAVWQKRIDMAMGFTNMRWD